VTQMEAFQEASRRWGEMADVRFYDEPPAAGWAACAVGRRSGEALQILGEGATWEEAFRDADARAKSPPVRAAGLARV
jgi:hypothetical protein